MDCISLDYMQTCSLCQYLDIGSVSQIKISSAILKDLYYLAHGFGDYKTGRPVSVEQKSQTFCTSAFQMVTFLNWYKGLKVIQYSTKETLYNIVISTVINIFKLFYPLKCRYQVWRKAIYTLRKYS